MVIPIRGPESVAFPPDMIATKITLLSFLCTFSPLSAFYVLGENGEHLFTILLIFSNS